jgi:hypothetical protein
MASNISIKHALNKKAKPLAHATGEFFPLELIVEVNGKKARIKSHLSEYLKIYSGHIDTMTNGDRDLTQLINTGLFSENMLKILWDEKKFPIYQLLTDEINVLKKVIELRKDKKGGFSLAGLEHTYQNCVKEITDIIDDYIKAAYQGELKTLFLNALDSTEKKDIFKIVNYLIHYINWNHPFYALYDATSELMPGEIKKVESYLTKDLLLSIKAYAAFYSYINPLKRFFEKKEQGRIASLSFLDWQSDIKILLIRQLGLMIGKKTAVLYVERLDKILKLCTECEV